MAKPQFDLLAHGFGLLEGPRYRDGTLFMSDVTRGGVYAVDASGAVTTVVPKRRGVGGIALHADGGLVISGRNVCHVRDGVTSILLEVPEVGGFNDLFTDEAGRVYVGSLRSDPFGGAKDRVPGELYRIDVDGAVAELYGEVGLTNGIGFSPDGRRIYHSDSAAGTIILHDVAENGEVSGRRVFATLPGGLPDGLAVDERGDVWVANYDGGGIDHFEGTGRHVETLPVPSRAVTSLCFGGEDLRDLFVVTADHTEAALDGCVLRTRVDTPGLPAPPARVAI